MNIKVILIGLLILASGFFYYNITGFVVASEEYDVIRVIDGDTFEIDEGIKVRMIGINTPEKLLPYGEEAEKFLRNKIENKTVIIENYGYDKYGRILAHVFLDETHINKEILEEGFGTLFYYEKDNYYDEMKQAEEMARKNKKNIWKESSKKNCLELLELKYTEKPNRCSNDELVVIKNNCGEVVQFIMKDDATHIYYEALYPGEVLQKEFSCIWNDDGDSLYVFDQEGMLIFYRYP
ncbi:MAG TPA: thermonuclease family protein [Candidatus Nanoarchaeia archaeon]|nr:thermonuclease family protein [Candidatus Nanoarchaeia archaeon]